MVKFAGLPVPGATITATMGDKKLVAVTDPQGVYSFADLADGVWNLQVEMLCFSHPEDGSGGRAQLAEPGVGTEAPAVRRDQGVGAAAPAPRRPAAAGGHAGCHAAIGRRPGCRPHRCVRPSATAAPKKGSKAAKAARRHRGGRPTPQPGFQRADLNASGGAAAAGAEPAAGGVDEAAPGANDALLVNGSVSNGVERRAIGNFRKGPGSGYRGDVSSILDNSALNARNFSLTGQDTPQVAVQPRALRMSRSADR